MKEHIYTLNQNVDTQQGRRKAARALLTTAIATLSIAHPLSVLAQISNMKEKTMKKEIIPKAFVYTELQNSVLFTDIQWQALNLKIAKEPGFLNKTWFSGVGSHSVGGIYSFNSIENAQHYCTVFFPAIAKQLGVAQTTRIFDALATKDASIDMESPHFGVMPSGTPGAFVYTEVQINVPFNNAPWQDRNPVLRRQKGLISKTWLSGLHTNTLGGVDAFDTIDNARMFAIEDFPKTAAKMNAAFYTRVFDANATKGASLGSSSPYYA